MNEDIAYFSGNFVGAVSYGTPIHVSKCTCSLHCSSVILGIATTLFFQCMWALLNPVNRTVKGVEWGLLAHTVILFSTATVLMLINLIVQFMFHTDFRGSGSSGGFTPSIAGVFFYSPMAPTTSLLFLFNQWLADGFLVCPMSNRVV